MAPSALTARAVRAIASPAASSPPVHFPPLPVTLFESDRFEPLWQRFLVATDPRTSAAPLRPEAVVVAGAAWEAWLTRRLARERGATVRPVCSTLAAFLLGVQRRALGEEARPGGLYFDADAWTLRIAAQLANAEAAGGDGPVERWLGVGGDADDRLERRVQLGRRLAATLDGYLLSRPELVEALVAERPSPPEGLGGREHHFGWQASLLGPLLRDSELGPAGPAFRRLADRLATEKPAGGVHPAVPGRVAVWATGVLAPAQLDGLEMLDAAGCQVTVLVRNASAEFVADMLPAAWFDDEVAATLDDPDQHRDLPHPLLAAWGQVERDRKLLLQAREDDPERPLWTSPEIGVEAPASQEEEAAADRGLLRALQASVRGAKPPREGSADADGSVAIHGCGGLRRQVEVLRERLLVAFDELPGLEPEDVVVLCPDPEAFAPHVEAVFSRPLPGREWERLSAHLSGRSPRRERPAVSAFFRLLEVLGGRAEAPEILALLSDPAFASEHSPEADQAAALGADVAAAGVSFGFDADHRAALGRPADATHTWEAGLDRLALGSLLPPPELGGLPPAALGGRVPLDRASRAEPVAGLAAFVEQVEAAAGQAALPTNADGWAERAVAWTADFLADDFDDTGRAQVRDAAAGLAEDATAAGLGEALPLAVWSAELGRRLDAAAGGGRFRLGGVTVCEPAAAAGLPHRVVAWLGLSDGAFPRRTPAAGFDLAAARHEPGDRPAAAVDRNRLLQSVMAAGDRFVVIGEDRDAAGEARAPAAVVAELLEVLGTLTGDPAAVAPVHHPMHAFSPDAFDPADEALRGVEPEMLAAAKALEAGRRESASGGRQQKRGQPPFQEAEKRGLTPFSEEVSLRDLEDLLCAAWKLRLRALGVGSDFVEDAPDSEDPQQTDSLEDWQLRDRLLGFALAGVPADEARARLSAAGRVPAGPMGEALLDELAAEAWAVAAEAQRAAGGDFAGLGRLRVEVRAGGGGPLVAGEVPHANARCHLWVEVGKEKPKRRAAAWVRHVALAAAGLGREGALVTRADKGRGACTLVFPPLDAEDARTHFRTMLRWWERAQGEALPCDAEVAAALAERADPSASFVEAAVASFHRGRLPGLKAVALDPAVRLAFGDVDPMELRDADGARLAIAMAEDLWSPLLRHLDLRKDEAPS